MAPVGQDYLNCYLAVQAAMPMIVAANKTAAAHMPRFDDLGEVAGNEAAGVDKPAASCRSCPTAIRLSNARSPRNGGRSVGNVWAS